MPSPACSRSTTCRSGRWSRSRSRTRMPPPTAPGSSSSRTTPARPRCRRRCTTSASSTSYAPSPACCASSGRSPPMMRYVSTRGQAPALTFDEVLLTGLARDGGLYVPESWPQLQPDQLRRFADRPYDAVAVDVMWPYVEGTIERGEFESMVFDAYARFTHDDVCPVRPLGGGVWLL